MTTTAPTATTPITDTLPAALVRDFSVSRLEYLVARTRRAGKDSPLHRAAVAEALSRIDTLLDLYLEACGGRAVGG